MVELLLLQQDSNCGSQDLVESLLHLILDNAIATFDLGRYVMYIKARWARTSSPQDIKSNRIGPIRQLYKSVCAHSNEMLPRLLSTITKQASEISKSHVIDFTLPLVAELLTLLDMSSLDA